MSVSSRGETNDAVEHHSKNAGCFPLRLRADIRRDRLLLAVFALVKVSEESAVSREVQEQVCAIENDQLCAFVCCLTALIDNHPLRILRTIDEMRQG